MITATLYRRPSGVATDHRQVEIPGLRNSFIMEYMIHDIFQPKFTMVLKAE